MLFKNRSILTGICHTREIPCTQDQLERYLKGVELIQDIFPELSADDREFLMTGITPEEWNAEFGDENVVYPRYD